MHNSIFVQSAASWMDMCSDSLVTYSQPRLKYSRLSVVCAKQSLAWQCGISQARFSVSSQNVQFLLPSLVSLKRQATTPKEGRHRAALLLVCKVLQHCASK